MKRICPGASACEQLHHALERLMNVDRHEPRQLARPEHPIDEISQPVGFFDDDPRVVALAFRLEFALQQLRRAADAAERILDFVREPANQLARGCLHRNVVIVAVDAQQSVERQDLDQQLGGVRSSIGVTV